MSGIIHEHEHRVTFDILDITQSAFAVDLNRQIVAWNAAAEQLLGLRAQTVVGRYCHEVMRDCHLLTCAACSCSQTVAPRSDLRMPTTEGNHSSQRSPGSDNSNTPSHHASIGMHTFGAHSAHGGLRIVHFLNAPPVGPLTPEESMRRASVPGFPRVLEERYPSDTSSISGERLALNTPLAPLTSREHEVLRLLAEGSSTTQICATLGISLATTRNHVAHVIAKMGASTRLQAVLIATQQRLI